MWQVAIHFPSNDQTHNDYNADVCLTQQLAHFHHRLKTESKEDRKEEKEAGIH